MAIKNIIAQGIGFSPGSTKFIPTLGFIADLDAPPVLVDYIDLSAKIVTTIDLEARLNPS